MVMASGKPQAAKRKDHTPQKYQAPHRRNGMPTIKVAPGRGKSSTLGRSSNARFPGSTRSGR